MVILVVFIAIPCRAITYGDFETSQGTLLEGFESAGDWSTAGTDVGLAEETDSYNVITGSKSLTLSTTDNNTVTMDKDIGVTDLSAQNGVFLFQIKINNADHVSAVDLYFSSVNDFSTNHHKHILVAPSGAGWLRIITSNFTNVGSEDWSTIRYFRIYFKGKGVGATSITLDDLRYGWIGTPKIIITFDDGLDGVYDYAYPTMAGNGQKGTVYVNSDRVGAAGKITLANLQTMYAAGWDIGNHGANHLQLSDISGATLDTEVNGCYDYLIANGFTRSAKYYAYAYGDYGTPPDWTKIAKVSENHVLGRSIQSWESFGAYAGPFLNQGDPNVNMTFMLPWYEIRHTTSLAISKTVIDWIIAKGSIGIFGMHNIVDAEPGSYEWNSDDFQEWSDYIKTKSDLGLVDVITMNDFYGSFSSEGGIVNNFFWID